jgi:O-antigen/teichoic acid export membrane protein
MGARASLFSTSRTPMVRNASALMVSTVVTSLLGVGFWAVAARTYSTVDVGLASAEISAMILLGNLSQLNLINVFPRFLQNAGHRTLRFVSAGYSAAIVLAVAVAVVFVAAGFGRHFLPTGLGAALLFIAAVVCWTIFTIQDAALTGLRGTIWVPVENISFSVVKIALLPLFAVGLGAAGIFSAWMLPVVVASVPVNYYLFRRLVPRHVEASNGTSQLPSRRALGTFVAGEYVGSLAQNLATLLLPLIVVARLGPTINAYFYTSWIVATSFDLLLNNIATSMMVEGSAAPEEIKAHTARAVRLGVVVVLPCVLVAIAAAPLFLGLLGHEYAENGTVLFRLVAIAMPFRGVVVLYMAYARLARRVRRVVIVQFVNAATVITLSLFLLNPLGIAGVGYAYLLTQFVVACCVLPSVLSQYAGGTLRRTARRSEPANGVTPSLSGDVR